MQVHIDPDELIPIIAATVRVTLQAVREEESSLGEKLAYSEAEAAGLISLRAHQLRDERLRGRIGASAIVGGRIRYTRADLLAYLGRQRMEARTV